MGSTLQRLLQAGLAPSTQRTYMSGKKKYLAYCHSVGVAPLPTSEAKLLNFVASMANQKLKHQTIKGYLSAVRHLQIECGGEDPRVEHMPLLELALRGVKREQACVPTRTRSPITPAVLGKPQQVWDPSNLNHIMLSAACCVAFFGFLRSGELTVAEPGGYDPGQHLTIGDVSVDNAGQPTRVTLRIKQSKTDPFRRGVSVHLHQTNVPLCPVSALLAYLVLRGSQDGPLFQMEGGAPLSRTQLVSEVRAALQAAGMDPSKYAGHSFRIGAATTAAACGVPVDIIKMLGRWRSDAYQLYVKIPGLELALISRTLASASM